MCAHIFLQRFLTGLNVSVSRQLLLKEQPETFEQAVTVAKGIEYALNFDTKSESSVAVQAINQPCPLKT